MKRLIAIAFLAFAVSAQAQTVTLDSGVVEGEHHGPVDRYLGIPFAAPPVGDLRWRAPQPLTPWKGTRPAKTAGSACAQIGNFFTAEDDPAIFGKPYGSEDCLYLNVWAPTQPQQQQQKLRPVLIFIHGGSGIMGAGSHPLYDSTRLASEGQMVVITANYRLGAIGSMQLPALHQGNAVEDSGSYFLLDIIKVLDWAKANAKAFGGDPDNITISGQSAGAVDVLSLLRSPLARGKFQRLASFSGLPFSSSAERAAERSNTFLQNLMIKDGSIKQPEELAAHLKQLGDAGLRKYLLGKTTLELIQAGALLGPGLVDDGTVLPKQAEPDGLVMDISNKVPVLIGTTRDEMTTLTPLKEFQIPLSERWPMVNGQPRTKTLYDILGAWGYLKFRAAVFVADFTIRRKAHDFYDHLAQQAPATYVYQFNWDHYPEPWLGEMGALHSLDLPFLFGNFVTDRPSYMAFAWTKENAAEREVMHQQMVAAMKNFVEHGDPNPPGQTVWPKWSKDQNLKTWE